MSLKSSLPPKLDIDEVIAAGELAIAQESAAIAIADDHNSFALTLHAALPRHQGNLLWSPLSVRTALAMTYAGARGETANEFQAVLRASKSGERFHEDWSATIGRLAPKSDAAHELAVANSLWTQAGAPILPAFSEAMARYYRAAAEVIDFERGPDAAREAINGWVSARTNRRIDSLLSPPLPARDTRLMLVNAVYFKGLWERAFDRRDTRDAPFFREDGAEIQAPLMYQRTAVGYREGGSFQAITLPYRRASLAMLVLLPDRGRTLEDVEGRLTVSMVRELAVMRANTNAEVFLPRFKVSWGPVDVVDALRAIGIKRAFTRQANFSGINNHEPPDPRALFVSTVLHKAVSEVNEEGTEAAAASAVCTLATGATPVRRPVFRADRPFLFAIVDTKSGLVLFLGRVLDPARGGSLASMVRSTPV